MLLTIFGDEICWRKFLSIQSHQDKSGKWVSVETTPAPKTKSKYEQKEWNGVTYTKYEDKWWYQDKTGSWTTL